jgi:hypothetical protein
MNSDHVRSVPPMGRACGLPPVGGTRFVFKDNGFADDVVKTNLAKILEQSGIEPDTLRSL